MHYNATLSDGSPLDPAVIEFNATGKEIKVYTADHAKIASYFVKIIGQIWPKNELKSTLEF